MYKITYADTHAHTRRHMHTHTDTHAHTDTETQTYRRTLPSLGAYPSHTVTTKGIKKILFLTIAEEKRKW